MRLWLLFVVLALVFSETEQACPQSTDPCTVAPCPCAGFTVVRIQTNSQNAKTTVVINATNYCTGGVYYVNFGLTDGTTTLSADLVGGGTAFNSQYAWTVNPTYGTSSPTRTWIQFANSGGGANSKMQKGSGSSQWDLFTFEVSNYNPTFGWYFQMHYGSAWDTYGPLDMSLCQCTNCDAGFSQRTIQPCVVGYADPVTQVYSGSTNRAYSVFNENQVLYSYAMYNNLLALFYSDEYPMTLGIQTITNSLTKETRSYPFSNGTQSPVCITGSNIKFGQVASFDGLDPWSAIDGNGPANGCNELSPPVVGKTCGRPMTPLMFISDITTQKNNISGDWQMYGAGVLPAKVCGLWQASVKTVTAKNADGTYTFSVVPVTTAIPPGNQNPVGSGLPFWNLGTGSDPPPIGFVNPSAVGAVPYLNTYGTEVAWDLDTLGLISTHSYRFQFLVHDGDSTKVGGDVGQACLITTQACPAGFSGTACDKCDTNPLPNDGSWTWFCSNTGSNPPYNLLKLPTSKVNAAPYKGNGFIPSLNYNDTQGYIVGCNCVRKTFTCPQACCGNGQCLAQNGTCKCTTAPAGTNLTTCCLPPPPPPPPPTCVANVSTIPGVNCTTCISNSFGLSCSWCAAPGVQAWTSAALVNGTCTAPKTCAGTEFTTCNLPPPPPPPPTCVANLTQAKGTNCTTCVSNIYGLTCSWCPQLNQSLWLQSALQNGTCQAVGTCAGVELKTCALQPPPPPPVAPPVTPPTAVPQYVPVCSDMTNPTYGGNQSCGACISNVRGLQCAWCATDLSAQPPNRTLVEGNCTTISGTCKSPLLFACVAPPPPPPPPPKPTCENVTVGPNFDVVNCSVCLGNPYGLTCVWCSDAGTTGLAILQNGTCMTNASTCPNAVSLTCDLPPPPPPPMTCENVSQIPDINCSTCISNIYSLQCAWCAEPANKSNGTCGAYGSCGANVELYACNTPCYNDGNYCSGHGSCVNETCVCDPQTGTGLGYTGPACNITVYPPPLTCANLTGVFNCSDCFAQSAIIGVRCAWCPNTTDPLRILTSGQCIEDYICGNSSYYSCTPPSVFVPPECADNCSNHGMCVNISTCRQIQSMDQGALIIHTTDDKGNDVTQIYTCDSANLNETLANNQTSLCACLDPYTGINCGVVGAGVNIKLAAGIAAGIIAAIVVLGILGLALCGGGAAAAASAVAAAPAAGVDMNPLYVGNDMNADNPLYA